MSLNNVKFLLLAMLAITNISKKIIKVY